jgi:hypothetical protein
MSFSVVQATEHFINCDMIYTDLHSKTNRKRYGNIVLYILMSVVFYNWQYFWLHAECNPITAEFIPRSRTKLICYIRFWICYSPPQIVTRIQIYFFECVMEERLFVCTAVSCCQLLDWFISQNLCVLWIASLCSRTGSRLIEPKTQK